MTRLHSLGLVMLLVVSSACQGVTFLSMPELPEWASLNAASDYLTVEACQNGWNNTREFVTDNAEAARALIMQNPYIAAAVAAGTLTVGGLVYTIKARLDARKKHNQEANDLIYALMLEQELQDEEYARQLQDELNGVVQPTEAALNEQDAVQLVDQLLADEDFAAYIQWYGEQPQVDVASEALAEQLMREEDDLYREQQAQIEADAQLACELSVQG